MCFEVSSFLAACLAGCAAHKPSTPCRKTFYCTWDALGKDGDFAVFDAAALCLCTGLPIQRAFSAGRNVFYVMPQLLSCLCTATQFGDPYSTLLLRGP